MSNNINQKIVGIWATTDDLTKVDFSEIRKLFLRELSKLVSRAAKQPLSEGFQIGMAGELPKLLSQEDDEALQVSITGAFLTGVQELVQQVVRLAVIELAKAKGGSENITNQELSYLTSYLFSTINDALLIAANTQVCLAEHGWPLSLPALDSLESARKLSGMPSKEVSLEKSLDTLDQQVRKRYGKSKKVVESYLREVTKEIKRLNQ